jgi:hypothetical protein
MPIHKRKKVVVIGATASLAVLLLGCGSDEPQESRDAGFVSKDVMMCIENALPNDLDIAPTGPYGEFEVVKPGAQACYGGTLETGDPVVAITFEDDSVVYVYGRNPAIGRPDIRLCDDQACKTTWAQYDLNEGKSLSGTVNNVAYKASRLKDGSSSKQLRLKVGSKT